MQIGLGTYRIWAMMLSACLLAQTQKVYAYYMELYGIKLS